MLGSTMIRTALVSVAVAGPLAIAVVDDTEPDDPQATTVGGPPPGNVDFQIDMVLGLVPADEVAAYRDDQEADRQRAIRACMNEAGFEYNMETTSTSVEDPLGDLSTLEYAEEWGLGVFTMMDPDNSPYADMTQDVAWPNEEVVGELSADDQNEWYETNSACTNASSMNVDPYANPMVEQALEDFSADVDAHPRMTEASAAWMRCMDEAGHPYADQNDMYEAIYGSDLQEQFYNSEAWKPDSPDHAEWQAMVDLEIAVAVANVTCSQPLDETRQEVIAELRPEFVDVWMSIDWSVPPATYPGEDADIGPGEDANVATVDET